MVGCFFSDGPRCQDSDVFANQLEQRWATYCSTCRHVFPWFAPGSEPVWDEPNKFCSTSRQNNIHDGFSGCKLGVRSILKIVQAQSDVLRTQWPRKLERGQGLSNSINSTSPHFTQSECVFVCVDEIVALGGVALGVPAARCDCDLRSFQQILVCRNQNHGFPLRKIWCPFIWKKKSMSKRVVWHSKSCLCEWIVCISIVAGGSPRCVWWVISDSLVVVWRLCDFTMCDFLGGWKTLFGVVSTCLQHLHRWIRLCYPYPVPCAKVRVNSFAGLGLDACSTLNFWCSNLGDGSLNILKPRLSRQFI